MHGFAAKTAAAVGIGIVQRGFFSFFRSKMPSMDVTYVLCTCNIM